MELSDFEFSDNMETSLCRRDEIGNRYFEQHNIYDSSQDILDACNRDLEELSVRVLKSSVRCHMLEVDLATQFNPHTQQMFADAQEACKSSTKAIKDICGQVSAEITPLKIPSPTVAIPTLSQKQNETTVVLDSFVSESAHNEEKSSGVDKDAVSNLQNAHLVNDCMENGSQ